MTDPAAQPPLTDRLRRLGARLYHHRHPFNRLMHAGRLSAADLSLWVANRYYYQTRIPIKDALILAKAEAPEFRRAWIARLHDHDGHAAPEDARAGGLALWLRLGEATGTSRAALEDHTRVLPEVARACDEYVELVREADLVTAVASSLTECFAGELMQARIEAWLRHYPWVDREALAYFEQRVDRSAADASFALRFVQTHAEHPEVQARCLHAFARKCEILWRLLDAVYLARRRAAIPRLTRRAALTGPRDAASRMLLLPEKALALSETAAALVERARGDRTLGDIVTELAALHDVATTTVERDVATFVARLEQQRALAFEPAGGAA